MPQTLPSLDAHTILIAPSHMHSALRLRYTMEQGGTLGLTILSLRNFYHRYEQEEMEELDILLAYREVLQAQTVHIYKSIISSYDFMKQCHAFIEEMKLYGIPVTALPETTIAQKEMKHIITALYKIRSMQDEENDAFARLSATSLASVAIMDGVWSMQDLTRIEKLKQLGAKMIVLDEKQPKMHYSHSINKRKEVEACAQWLCQEKRIASDFHILVCDPSYPPLIKQVFERYHIPFTILKQTKTSIVCKRVQLLLRYVLAPSMSLVLELIECNTFQAPHRKEFVEYVRAFGKELTDSFDHIHTFAKPSQLISEQEIEQLMRLEIYAQECYHVILPQLAKLTQLKEPEALLSYINSLTCSSIKPTDQGAIGVLKQIHEGFQSFLPHFHEPNDITFLLEILDDINESATETQLHGALISELHAPLLPHKNVIVFGCTQKLYPAFPAKKGLFDEAYVRRLPTYPAMTLRNQTYMKQLEHTLSCYEELIVSYPIGGYDGKANEGALEMEQFLKQPSVYQEPLTSYLPIPMQYQISEDRAQALFLREDKIYGSISAFESYMRCPFSYFLSYGLKLKEPMDYSFSQSRIGTLSHAILEHLVHTYGKAYASASMKEVEAYVAQELQAMSDVYPLLKIQLPMLQQRLLYSIQKNMEYLKEAEEHSHLTPVSCEEEFWWELPFDDKISICLHGFIDRIDASSGYLRIVDYKSSSKSLSEKDVFAGLQLQLITYALYAETTYQKEVLGAFYYSMKHENIHAGAGKLSRRPVMYHSIGKEELATARLASKRMRGWAMHHDMDVIDDDGTHIYGLRRNKDGIVKARKTYDLKRCRELFYEMYEQIARRILHGDIDCSPTEDACTFCPYREVCRFQGYPRAIQPIVEVDDRIYLGGE